MRLLVGIALIVFGVGIGHTVLAQNSSGGSTPRTCKEYREGLPTQDPMFQLTGKITMRSGPIYEVTQFGRSGAYRSYGISTRDRYSCYFGFHQISRIDFDAYAKRWRLTLLNGQSPDNIGNLYHSADGVSYMLSALAVDKEKFGFLVIAKTPQLAQPQEMALDPGEIASIEIFNPTASAPASVTGSSTAKTPATGPKLKFTTPTEIVSFPPPHATRTGMFLLFSVDANGATTLASLFDVAENAGKGRIRVEPGKQELIWISEDGKQAAPSWYETVPFSRDNRRFTGDGRFVCLKGLGQWKAETGGNRGQQKTLTMYNPCASVLTLSDNSGASTIANTAAAVLTFGLALAAAQNDEKRIDRDKVLSVLEKATPEIDARLEQLATRRYREDFAAAKNIELFSQLSGTFLA